MPSLKTVYRAIVMIAAGVIVVKGWQLYGPPAEKVKSFAVAALEKAQTALKDATASGENSPAAQTDPRSMAPVVVADAATPSLPASAISAPQLVPSTSGQLDPPVAISDATPPTPGTPPAAIIEEDPIAKLLSQLEQMGAADARVAPWGSGGQLFRCCCRAKLAETSPLARHFEAVAGAPTEAVEQVVAKVEAWRSEQQNLLR